MKKVTRRVLGLFLAMVMVIGQLASAGTVQVSANETGNGTWEATSYITNGDLEAGDVTGWNITYASWDGAGYTVKVSDGAVNNVTNILNYWNGEAANTLTFSTTVSSVPAGTYRARFDMEGAAASTGLQVTIADVAAQVLPTTTGWDAWTTVTTSEFTLAEATDVTLTISGEVPAGYWGDFDNFVLEQFVPAEEGTEASTGSETTTENNTTTELDTTTEDDTTIAEDTEVTPVYAVEVSPTTGEATAGDTVSLTAVVTVDGEEVTDLEEAGLKLWWWADTWNDHSDGNNDAVLSNYDNNSGYSFTVDVKVPTAGTYYLIADVEDETGKVATSLVTITVTGESDVDEYVVTVTADETSVKAGDTITLSAKVIKNGKEITDLEAEGYYLWWWTDVWAEGHTDGKDDAVYSNYDANSGHSLTADVTLPSVGDYYIVAELQDAEYVTLTKSDIALETTDPNTFIVADNNYTVAVTVDTLAPETGDTVKMTAKVTKADGTEVADLEAAGLSIWWWTDTWAEGHANGLTDAVYSNYDNNSGKAFTANVTLPSTGTYFITAQLQGADVDLKAYVDLTTTEAEVDTNVTGEITVEKIKDLPADFAMGMDISSIMSEFASGVTYKDFEGNTIDNIADFCKFIAENGITHVRVRVWVDPFDANGNGYGGGNNDIATAAAIAEGCRAAGIKMLVDFHCSDFWADPGKQQVPKDWAGYTLDQKKEAVYNHILNGLNVIDPNCETVDMVQVGNETTGGFVGENNTTNMCALFAAGSEAVRAYNEDAKVVIHVTNPEKGNVTKWAKNLSDNAVDYDIIATSYYPYWHGTFDNLISELKAVKETYGKDTMVAETSYAYTLEDFDGHSNTVRVGNNDADMAYPFSVQGQATFMRDVMDAVNTAGGLGVFYWESAWITVGDTSGLEGAELDAQINANKALWEKHGSGWASSFAAEYDAADAGLWYGGSAVDNQAMFYSDGTPTAAMYVWNYVKTGAVSKYTTVESIETLVGEIEANTQLVLPETVAVTYNSGVVSEAVEWNEADREAVDTAIAGTYKINGVVTFSKTVDGGDYAGKQTAEVVYTLIVKQPNLITDAADAGFESGVNFVVEGSGISAIPAKDDPYAGNGSMHWYHKTATTGMVTYNKVITLEAGKYTLEAKAQGFAGDTVTLEILDKAGKVLVSGDEAVMQGWCVWQTPSVSFEVAETLEVMLRVVVTMQDGGWGTADALYLYKTGEVSVPGGSDDIESGDTGYLPPVKDNGNVTEDVVTSGDTEYRVLTSQQMSGVEVVGEAGILPEGADFSISQPTDGTAAYEKAEKAVRNYLVGHKGFLVYEMNLTAANGASIEQLKDYINVTIPIPKVLKAGEGERYVVYRVEDNGRLTRCTTATADGRLTFATNHFSTYVVTVEAVSAISPKTTDDTITSAYFAMILLGMGIVVMGLSAKKRYL